MKISRSQLKKIIFESLKNEGVFDDITNAASSAYDYVMGGNENLGAGLILVSDVDLIGRELKNLISHKQASEYLSKIGQFIPTGHAYVAIIDKNGKMTACSFGPPACKNPEDIIDKVLASNPVPFFTSMTKNIKKANLGFKIKNGKMTASQARIASKKCKSLFKQGDLSFFAFDEINVESALQEMGGSGCKAYSIVPVGMEIGDLDADNCATFAVDVIQAGSSFFSFRNLGLSLSEILTAPSALAKVLPAIADHAGTI